MKRWWFGFVLWSVAVSAQARAPLDKAIHNLGFAALTPPATLLEPGTVVVRTKANPLTLRVLCAADSAVGEGVPTLESAAPEVTRALAVKRGFALGASYFGASLNVDGAIVESVTLTLRNPRVIELPIDAAHERIDQHRTDYCRRAIEDYASRGEAITMVSAVLQADVEYEVTLANAASLDAGGLVSAVTAVAARLQVSNATVSGTTIRGTSLFFGVQHDQNLAYYNLPGKKGLVDDVLGPTTNVSAIDPEPIAVPPPAPDPAAGPRSSAPEAGSLPPLK